MINSACRYFYAWYFYFPGLPGEVESPREPAE